MADKVKTEKAKAAKVEKAVKAAKAPKDNSAKVEKAIAAAKRKSGIGGGNKKERKLRTLLESARTKLNEKLKQDDKTAGGHKVTSNKLELMITVVGRHKAEYYMDLIQSFDVNMQLVALANGTANAGMLEYLGLADNEKAVIFSVIQQNKLQDAMNTLEEKFQTIRDGHGVSFTVPLTSVIGSLIYRFLSNNRMEAKETKKA